MTTPTRNSLRVGLVVPHIFMHQEILGHVIFSPGQLALQLADGLTDMGVDVTLFSPGHVVTKARNVTADLSHFEHELAGRGDSYLDLLKKHPFTFVTLARQVQAEIIAKAYDMANKGELDVVHIYTNEEDTALPFAALCHKPVVFTHHDPFNFLVKYKNVFPKYKHLNWISLSHAQRKTMPADTNWVANIYHGLPEDQFSFNAKPHGNYVAYFGRIIQNKGVHVAIEAAKKAGIKLKIAGKHYSGKKDEYWQTQIEPLVDGKHVEYVGFLRTDAEKQEFLGNAKALLMPSQFDEPFGLSAIEALGCGTPVIGTAAGALPEIIKDGHNGFIAEAALLHKAIAKVGDIDRAVCRADFVARFSAKHMVKAHLETYVHIL